MFPENMHVYAKNEMKALKLCLPIEKYVRAFLFPVINIFCHKHILFETYYSQVYRTECYFVAKDFDQFVSKIDST